MFWLCYLRGRYQLHISGVRFLTYSSKTKQIWIARKERTLIHLQTLNYKRKFTKYSRTLPSISNRLRQQLRLKSVTFLTGIREVLNKRGRNANSVDREQLCSCNRVANAVAKLWRYAHVGTLCEVLITGSVKYPVLPFPTLYNVDIVQQTLHWSFVIRCTRCYKVIPFLTCLQHTVHFDRTALCGVQWIPNQAKKYIAFLCVLTDIYVSNNRIYRSPDFNNVQFEHETSSFYASIRHSKKVCWISSKYFLTPTSYHISAEPHKYTSVNKRTIHLQFNNLFINWN